PVPEGLLIYNGPKAAQRRTEGESWLGDYSFINISSTSFDDSLTMRYEVFNQVQHLADANEFKIKSPLPGDTTNFVVHVNTFNKAGVNDVSVYVNPRIAAEQYYDNNLLQMQNYLVVEEERFRPVLDVTVNGRYLQNRDYVPSTPQITIKVFDENRVILKTDTVGMKIFLTYPCDFGNCTPTPVWLSKGEIITWHPATASAP